MAKYKYVDGSAPKLIEPTQDELIKKINRGEERTAQPQYTGGAKPVSTPLVTPTVDPFYEEGPAVEQQGLGNLSTGSVVVYQTPEGFEEEGTFSHYDGESKQAVIQPKNAPGTTVQVDLAMVRAAEAVASALDGLNSKYDEEVKVIQAKLKSLKLNPSEEEYQRAKFQSNMQIRAVQERRKLDIATLKAEEAAKVQEEIVPDILPEQSREDVSNALKAGKDPVDVYLENRMQINPNNVEEMEQAKLQVLTVPTDKADFIKWAYDNRSLPEMVAWSQMQKTLDESDSNFFDGITHPTKKLKVLSTILNELTESEVAALLNVIQADPSIFQASSLDDFVNAWTKQVVVILDTETIGRDTDKDDIIQISAIKHYPDGKIVRFNKFIKTSKTISAEITRLTGIDKDVLSKHNARDAKTVLKEFQTFLGDADSYVAHKVDFDAGMINNNAKRAGIEGILEGLGEFDSLQLAEEAKPYIRQQSSLALENLVNGLNIKVDLSNVDQDAQQHRADYDTQALYQVLQHLMNAHKAMTENSVSIPQSREKLVTDSAKLLFELFPDVNPQEALSTMLFANEFAQGTLPAKASSTISSHNKAAAISTLHSVTNSVDYQLMLMLANVMNEDGITAVTEGANELTGTNVTFTKTLIALAEQFGASKNTPGMDAELSFALTLSVFAGEIEGFTMEPSLDERHIEPAQQFTEEKQEAINLAKAHLRIGENVQKLLHIEGIDPAVTASLGAIAKKAVSDATQVDAAGVGYFDAVGNLNHQGRQFAYNIAPLAETMLGSKKDSDQFRTDKLDSKGNLINSGEITTDEWDNAKRFKNLHILKKSAFDDKGVMNPDDMFEHIKTQLDYDPTWMRKALLELHNMSYRWDTDLVKNIDEIINDPAANKLLKIEGYKSGEENVEGTFKQGRNRYVDKLDEKGQPILKADHVKEQNRFADLQHKYDNKTIKPAELAEMWQLQEYVYDQYSTDPKFYRANVQESYQGDILKDTVVQRFISMVAPKKADGSWDSAQLRSGAFYTDWFYGLNGRAYMKQYIGNFQSSKLARASIQADINAVYDTPKKIQMLKAGIMKKFGGKYAKMGVDEAAGLFEAHAKHWHALMYPDGATEQNWSANASAILAGTLDEATNTYSGGATQHEGFLSLSAMREGARLWQKYRVKDTRGNDTIGGKILSRFFTEVDGVANGTAHNAMQSGLYEAASATNLNPFIAFNSELFDKMKGRHGEDVYAISGASLIALVDQESRKGRPYLKELFQTIGLYDTSKDSKILRDFMKKPMMIFGYGAGKITIIKAAKEGLGELINDAGIEAKVISSIKGHVSEGNINLDNKTEMNWFFDEVGSFANQAVSQNFGAIKTMTSLLSAIATAAVEQGITPTIRMPNGNIIVFGMRTETPKQISFTKKEAEEAERTLKRAELDLNRDNTPENRLIVKRAAYNLRKINNSLDAFNAPIFNVDASFNIGAKTNRREGSGTEYQVDAKYIRAHRNTTDVAIRESIDKAVLKAATQAAVLITHNFDSINMLNGIMNARKLGAGSAAQVFDGIFMTPLDASNYSKQLNKEFLRLHSNFFYLDQFMSDIKKLIEDDAIDTRTGKMKKKRFDTQTIKRLYKDMNTVLNAHKRLLRHFEFGSRFIKQFFWDGATKRDLELVQKMQAKAALAGKELYSLKDYGMKLEDRLRGKNVPQDIGFENSFFDARNATDKISIFE